jgi:hypothetical protein
VVLLRIGAASGHDWPLAAHRALPCRSPWADHHRAIHGCCCCWSIGILQPVITSLALLGLPLTGLLTASLVVVVILGIALQQSISNLAATIMFMLFQPF